MPDRAGVEQALVEKALICTVLVGITTELTAIREQLKLNAQRP